MNKQEMSILKNTIESKASDAEDMGTITNYDKIKSLSIEELASFLAEYGEFDPSPWMKWWDETYCKKCDTVEIETKWGKSDEAYCNLENKCRFFPELDKEPSIENIILMWLKEKVNMNIFTKLGGCE